MKPDKICAFTGHRPEQLPWGNNEWDGRCVDLKQRLDAAVERAYESGCRHFVCGMARGSDFYFCEAVIALRERHPDVTLEAALPCADHTAKWNDQDLVRYQELLSQCDVETLVQKEFDSTCMYRRNVYLVEHAARLIAVFNGDPQGGGTLQTVSYALNKGLETDILQI